MFCVGIEAVADDLYVATPSVQTSFELIDMGIADEAVIEEGLKGIPYEYGEGGVEVPSEVVRNLDIDKVTVVVGICFNALFTFIFHRLRNSPRNIRW